MSATRNRQPIPVVVVADEGYVGQEGVHAELGPAYQVELARGGAEVMALVPTLDVPIVLVPDALADVQGHKLLAELATLGRDFVGLLLIDDLVGVPRPGPGSGIAAIVQRPLRPGALAMHVGAAACARAEQRRALAKAELVGKDLDTLRDSLRHELRGQLQTVVGLASLLLEIERPNRKADDELLDWIGRIAAGGDRMTRLVDHVCDWLALSRRDLDLGVVDLGETVLEAIAEARVAHAKRAARITTEPGDVTALKAKLRADARSVAQAIRHLVDNALRYDPSEEPQVVVRLQSPPAPLGGWVVSVHDRGPGLPASAQARVFKLFERHQHDPTKPAGTGVGLAIVAKVAERHGGRAWIEANADGPGITVHIWLPSPPA
ncbi:MAG: HAMP domain-containing histidine kinase [Deltaproteobacteria bacterium]|nr:HAMP domain-containing histidine kinase [Deltaproteobacteria bacterium]